MTRKRSDPRIPMLHMAKRRAKESGVPFDLELDDIVIPYLCPVLAIPLSRGEGGMHDGSPTLDRHIPELGYVKGNVTVISWKANRLKSNGTWLELQAVADYAKRVSQPSHWRN